MDLRGPTSKGREETKDGNAGKGKKEGGSTSKARREGRGDIGLAPNLKAKLRPWQ